MTGRITALAAVAACSFEPGTLAQMPGDGGPDATDAMVDASPDSTVDAAVCPAATVIAASGPHTCVALSNGRVRCWGRNNQGENGLAPGASPTCYTNNVPCVPTPHDPNVPVAVTALGLGDQHTCASGGGSVYCWGANDSGQFGNGNAGDSATPVLITARAGATKIAAGATHTCSITGTSLACSGVNSEGEVGDGTTMARYTPVSTTFTGLTALGTGYLNTCAVFGGSISCWGDNSTSQVDQSGMDPRPSPTPRSIAAAIAVAGGSNHICAVHSTKNATCWGANNARQLGRNTMSTSEPPGLVTITANNIEELTAGTNHTCVRRTDGSVFCWGEGYAVGGEVIALARPAVAIASGSYHDCAIVDDGTVWCWGINWYGQYGNGTHAAGSSNTPVQSLICP